MHRRGPTALETGLVIAATLFGLLLHANGSTIMAEIAVRGDHAADILLTQTAAHDGLLTGHYDRYGVHHPGPFFLYARLIGQWLVGGRTPTVFGAQLVGVIGCSAAFAGLFAAIIHRLARQEGACHWTAASAAIVALILVAMQFSVQHTALPRPGYNIHGTFAAMWMPEVIILPFLTFMAASILLLRGSVFGLVAATFSAAALVHGYIPMPLIVGPLWLIAVIVGWRTRRATTGRGFPSTAWASVILTITVFALPLVLDAILNPPGNIMAILAMAPNVRQEAPLLSYTDLLFLLDTHWLGIHHGLWLPAIAGLAICVASGRYRRLLRDGLIVTAFIVLTSAVTYSQTPEPPLTYTTRYFEATALLPIILGAVLVTLELSRRSLAFALAEVAALLIVFPVVATLFTPYRNAVEVSAIARFIAGENTPGSQIWLESTIRPGVIAGILLELEKMSITGCSTNPSYGYILTPRRICPPSLPPEVPTYRFSQEACPADAALLSRALDHNIIVPDARPVSVGIKSVCFRVHRLQS